MTMKPTTIAIVLLMCATTLAGAQDVQYNAHVLAHDVYIASLVPEYGNVSIFMDALPDCDWCNQCTTWARYTRLEAEKQNVSIGEITLVDTDTDRVQHTLCSGHRMNYFDCGGERMYIDNSGGIKQLLHGHEIKAHIEAQYGLTIGRVSFKDVLPANIT